MIKTAAACLALMLATAPALADEPSPSDASIRELLTITDARNLLEGVRGQMSGMIDSTMKQAAIGKELTPDAQAILDRMKSKMLAAMDDMMQWDAFEPMYLRTYKASFSQGEIDSMIAIYKTPAGQTLVKKMPVVMKNMMAEMPGMMQPMLQRIRTIQQETIAELNALDEKRNDKKPKK